MIFDQHPAPFASSGFRAICTRVVDGDTYRMAVDCGFRITHEVTVRLMDLDTPEIRTRDDAEKARGIAATERARQLIEDHPVMLHTQPDPQTFGRYVAVVKYWNGDRWVDLAETLRAEGHGK